MNAFKKHHKKIYRFLMGFIYILIPIVLYVLITSRTSIFFGNRTFTVLTGSMEPKIHVASIVMTAPASSYKVGDIISFTRGNITVTHRIVAIKGNMFQTKGDANKVADPQLVNKLAIIGKDFLIIPYIGRFTEFIKTVPGFIIFIVLPTFIYIGFEIKTIKTEWEKEIEKKLLKKFSEIEKA